VPVVTTLIFLQIEGAVWPADLHRWAKMAPDEKSAKGS
jgi:hypothetical protein